MRYTRRGFGRRALTFGLAIFCAITLTSVGFAAWVLSNNASIDTNGGIVTETVTDISIKIEITNSDENKQLYEEVEGEDGKVTVPQVIAFAPIAPEEGLVNDPAKSGQIQNDGNGYSEDLSFTVKGTVDNILAIEELYFNVRVPDSLIKAAGLTKGESGKWSYDPAQAFIRLPSFAMDKSGNPIPYIQGSLENPVEAEGETQSDAVMYKYTSKNSDIPAYDAGNPEIVALYTKSVIWKTPGGNWSDENEDTVTDLDGNPFIIKKLGEDKLEFTWTIHFAWGARYLGMNPNYFYDVNERVEGTHDTLTLASEYPNQYTVGNMNLVNYDLLLMQAVINGLELEDYLSPGEGQITLPEGLTYKNTDIALDEEETLEDYIKDPDNEDSIKSSLKDLQTNIYLAIENLGNQAPSYAFWIRADAK